MHFPQALRHYNTQRYGVVQVLKFYSERRNSDELCVVLKTKEEVLAVTFKDWVALLRDPIEAPNAVSPSRDRPSWDDYFIQMCHLVATRATCDRKHVGAVLVRDRRVLATGYNGSPPGEPHCDDVGHDLVKQADGRENCVRTIHAEANAVLQAAKYGVQVDGTSLYTNTYPCWPCAKLILGAGIREVVVDTDYNNDPRVEAAFTSKGVVVRRYKFT